MISLSSFGDTSLESDFLRARSWRRACSSLRQRARTRGAFRHDRRLSTAIGIDRCGPAQPGASKSLRSCGPGKCQAAGINYSRRRSAGGACTFYWMAPADLASAAARMSRLAMSTRERLYADDRNHRLISTTSGQNSAPAAETVPRMPPRQLIASYSQQRGRGG